MKDSGTRNRFERLQNEKATVPHCLFRVALCFKYRYLNEACKNIDMWNAAIVDRQGALRRIKYERGVKKKFHGFKAWNFIKAYLIFTTGWFSGLLLSDPNEVMAKPRSIEIFSN